MGEWCQSEKYQTKSTIENWKLAYGDPAYWVMVGCYIVLIQILHGSWGVVVL